MIPTGGGSRRNPGYSPIVGARVRINFRAPCCAPNFCNPWFVKGSKLILYNGKGPKKTSRTCAKTSDIDLSDHQLFISIRQILENISTSENKVILNQISEFSWISRNSWNQNLQKIEWIQLWSKLFLQAKNNRYYSLRASTFCSNPKNIRWYLNLWK